MTYTTTEERVFTSSHTHPTSPVEAVDLAWQSIQRQAGSIFNHVVGEGSSITVSVNAGGRWQADMKVTYARIVSLLEKSGPNEGDVDGEREARGPEEKDYSDLEFF